MTVFITQESANRNFLPARRYGDLVPLLPGNAQIILSAAPVVRKLKFQLKNFSDDDYLLMSGDPLIMGVAVYEALRANNGKAKFLKWDKREGDYYDVFIDVNEKEEFYDR